MPLELFCIALIRANRQNVPVFSMSALLSALLSVLPCFLFNARKQPQADSEKIKNTSSVWRIG